MIAHLLLSSTYYVHRGSRSKELTDSNLVRAAWSSVEAFFFFRMFRHPFSPDCLLPYITVIWVFYFTYTFYLQHFLYIHPLSPDFTHCFSRDLGTLFTRQSHTLISHLKKATKGACCIYCLIKEVFFLSCIQ